MSAIIEYRKHNKGNLPFTEHGTKLDVNFAPRYLDLNCTNVKFMISNPSSGDSYNTSGAGLYTWTYEGCSEEFTDPDGTVYALGYAQGAANGGNTIRGLKAEHIITVATNSRCGNMEDELEYVEGVNNFVVTYNLEGDQLYCVDNS